MYSILKCKLLFRPPTVSEKCVYVCTCLHMCAHVCVLLFVCVFVRSCSLIWQSTSVITGKDYTHKLTHRGVKAFCGVPFELNQFFSGTSDTYCNCQQHFKWARMEAHLTRPERLAVLSNGTGQSNLMHIWFAIFLLKSTNLGCFIKIVSESL